MSKLLTTTSQEPIPTLPRIFQPHLRAVTQPATFIVAISGTLQVDAVVVYCGYLTCEVFGVQMARRLGRSISCAGCQPTWCPFFDCECQLLPCSAVCTAAWEAAGLDYVTKTWARPVRLGPTRKAKCNNLCAYLQSKAWCLCNPNTKMFTPVPCIPTHAAPSMFLATVVIQDITGQKSASPACVHNRIL